MCKIFKLFNPLVLTLVLACLFHVQAKADETYPKREARGVWVASLGIDWPSQKGTTSAIATKQKAEADEYLDNLKAAGFNTVYFHARPMADRLFQIKKWTDPNTGKTYSLSEPASLYLSGTRGTEGAFDALQYWIDGAHSRGMELYMWMNPFRIGSKANVNALANQTLAATAMKGTNHYFYNPAKESVKSHLEDITGLITGAYDIDGIVFDDYFYQEGFKDNDPCEDQADYQSYTAAGGKLSLGDWRREQVNECVRRVQAVVKSIKPYVKFCIGPAGVSYYGVKSTDNVPDYKQYIPKASDWQYDGIFADPIAWLREGSIDIISPQMYWLTTHSTNPYGPLCEWWTQAAKAFGQQCYGSHSCTYLATSGDTQANRNDMLEQVRFDRQYAKKYGTTTGSIFYSVKNVTRTGLANDLHTNVYQKPALTPIVNGDKATNPGKVANLNNSSNTLKWTAVSPNRYVVYAIPNSVSVSSAKSADGGFKAEYILDVTYTNSMAIPSEKRSGYWYAVTILDRFGNEWEASTLNAPYEDQVKLTLSSPASNTQFEAEKPVTFKWSGTTDATFTLEVSTSQSFSSTVFTKTGTNLFETSVSTLPSGTLYWRVKGTKTDFEPAVSETRTIKIANRPLTTPKLAYPVNNANIIEDINFVVENISADYMWLEISVNDSFEPMFYTSKDGWSTKENLWFQKTMPLSMLPEGTYYWRVRVSKAGYDDGYSETRLFKVGNGGQGSSYVPYREETPYSEQKLGSANYQLNNLWLRNANHNALDRGIELYRDMVARPASGADQPVDIVYLAGRTEASSSAQSHLARYDASTGEELEQLPLSYDSDYNPGTYPSNGILVDADNNLITHNLAVAGSTFSMATVNPATGKCKTVFATAVTYRVDHACVVGSVTSGTAYVLAASPVSGNTSTIIQRWTLTNGVITKHETFNLGKYYGAACRVHAINQTLFYVDGSSLTPTLYRWNNTSAVGSSASAPNAPVGMCVFAHDGQSYLVHAVTDFGAGLQFGIYSGSDFASSLSGQTHRWTFPHEGLGVEKMVSSDFGTPVCALQYGANGDAQVRAIDAVKTNIFAYSPGNGLAAYSLTKQIYTGLEVIEDDDSDSTETAVYYNLQGIPVDIAKALPGIYIRRQGSQTQKVLLK